jgi:hypothetical protein
MKEIELKEAILEEKEQQHQSKGDIMLEHGFARFYPMKFLTMVLDKFCINGHQPDDKRLK